MEIKHNSSLKPYNTFGIEVSAKHFVEIHSVAELQELQLSDYFKLPKLILGGGSNILFTKDFDGLAIKLSIKGIEKLQENNDHVMVKVGAGENWHQFVLTSIENKWAGIENMSLIPGTVGAAPMQNIGAYGVEIKEVFVELEAFNIQSGETKVFNKEACEFGYRWSVFKGELKDQYIITSVTFQLAKQPTFKTEYGDIKNTLEEMNVTELSIKAISDAVVKIRQSKLPDPKQLGNAGSFFKNPEIPKNQFEKLKEKFPAVPGYPVSGDLVKVPAGWLIDQAGWKGRTIGAVGVHKNQALVLVNYGKGTGEQIYSLAMDIKRAVKNIYDVDINPEVNIY